MTCGFSIGRKNQFKKYLEDIGELTGYTIILSPIYPDTITIGTVMIHDFEEAVCACDLEGNIIVTRVRNKGMI